MTEQAQGGALARVTKIASNLIRTPMDLAERMRELKEQAHLITPAMNVAAIPEHIAINPVVVVVDTRFDPKTGRGDDVYFQKSIHKSEKKGRGDDAEWVPLEVSLNATTIKRIMGAAGVNVVSSVRTDDGKTPNYWSWESRGKVRDFDGSWRDLPPGNVEIDLRDGSAQIGEWTAEQWARNEAASEKKKANLSEKDQWKAKPDLIGGWSGDRVMAARRFGLRLAEAKSLNALGRNLGLKQIYSIEELKKPFVIFRATWMPDMSDPVTRQMVTAAELGVTNLLYPGASASAALPAAPAAVAAEPATDSETAAAEQSQGDTRTDAPSGKDESFGEEPQEFRALHVTDAGKRAGGGFYVAVQEMPERLLTDDESAARAAHGNKQAGKPIYVEIETRKAATGFETWILELRTERPTEDKGL